MALSGQGETEALSHMRNQGSSVQSLSHAGPFLKMDPCLGEKLPNGRIAGSPLVIMRPPFPSTPKETSVPSRSPSPLTHTLPFPRPALCSEFQTLIVERVHRHRDASSDHHQPSGDTEGQQPAPAPPSVTHRVSLLAPQGLFRLAAGASVLKRLKQTMASDPHSLEEFCSDPHAVAGT